MQVLQSQPACNDSFTSPRIQQEACVSIWLDGLGVDTERLKHGHVNLLLDPLRNGLLLLHLARQLRNAPCSSSSNNPTDVAAARRNIVTALLHLGLFDTKASHSPGACLLQDVELMLQGQPRIVWSLLDRVRQHVSHHQPAPPDPSHRSQQRPQAPVSSSPQSVSCMHPSQQPTSASSPPAQQHQGMHAQRPGSQQGRMPNTFPPSQSIRRVQEQLRQQHQDVQQRASFSARISQSGGDQPHDSHLKRPATSPQGRSRLQTVSVQQASQYRTEHAGLEAWHDSRLQAHGHPALHEPVRHGRLVDASHGRSKGMQPHSHDIHQQDRRDSHQEARRNLARAAVNGHHMLGLGPSQACKEPCSSKKHCQVPSAQFRQALQQGQAGTEGGTRKRRSKPARPGLMEWLQQKGIDLGSSCRMEETFADGILLCHLVQNRWHPQLAGVTWTHPSPAAARHNITQALNALHDVPKMPLTNLWRASDIADATPGAVQALLHDLRHADARSV
ncbi:hypothetical protein WJX74_004825 [Apatococcus lobatus]|uniref:Calponin-homology (CH) domain-containing protein n=1 Tax=Apatococcus lobatus TaxID=904363 RepID=A0AAW1S5Y9_9CHLO